ncbi:hypothetical protein Tco_0339024 [Tanacetum coccineum]
MAVRTLGSLVQKVILASSLVILLLPVLTYFTTDRRTKKIMETMNVTFDKLSAMAFEQTMYDDYIGGQPPSATRTAPAT